MKASTMIRALSVCLCIIFASTSAVSALCTGSVVSTPQLSKFNGFSAAFATASDNAWAAGGTAATGLLDHWNGERWARIGLERRIEFLDGLAGRSPSDVWAVGIASDECGSGDAIAIHWNGHEWKYLPSGFCADIESYFTGIAEAAPKDVWAVGVYIYPGRIGFTGYEEVASHWTGGSHWTNYQMPDDPLTTGFTAVAAPGPGDVWAVGTTVTQRLRSWDLIYHFDGAKWSDIRFKNPEVYGSLAGLGAVSKNDVWAVGGQSESRYVTSEPLILHWNGASWHVFPHASAPPDSTLSSVVAISSDDVWAVGTAKPNGTHIEHWNGIFWSTVSTSIVGDMTGLGAIPGERSVWAVGSTQDQFGVTQSLAAVFHC